MTALVASLPMYDLPELRPATDAFWSALRDAVRARGFDAPDALDRSDPYAALWESDGLLLSQTCGYPYVTRLRGRLRLVATPCYDAFGCEGPRYASALVTRAEDPGERLADFRGRRAAFNGRDSQSGYNTLRAAVAPLATDGRFFGELVESGAHRASLEAVAEGRADLCAVDGVTWSLLTDQAPALTDRLKTIGASPQAPGLPFVTALDDAEAVVALRAALVETISRGQIAEPLRLRGVEALPDAAYEAVLDMERSAASYGYPELS